MLKKRNAQGMSITVIVVAIIALIVLVVLMFIFGEGTRDTMTVMESCTAKGGICVTDEECTGLDGRPVYGGECEEEGDICCAALD